MMGISLLHAEEFTKPAVFDEVKQHLIDEFYLVRKSLSSLSLSLYAFLHVAIVLSTRPALLLLIGTFAG
jgi:hypothetical protein